MLKGYLSLTSVIPGLKEDKMTKKRKKTDFIYQFSIKIRYSLYLWQQNFDNSNR